MGGVLWLLMKLDIYDIHLSQEILKKDFACQRRAAPVFSRKNVGFAFFFPKQLQFPHTKTGRVEKHLSKEGAI